MYINSEDKFMKFLVTDSREMLFEETFNQELLGKSTQKISFKTYFDVSNNLVSKVKEMCKKLQGYYDGRYRYSDDSYKIPYYVEIKYNIYSDLATSTCTPCSIDNIIIKKIENKE